MKNFILLPLFAIVLVFTSCQPERINQEIATQKSEQFLAPANPEWERAMIISNINEVEIWLSQPIVEANSLTFDHRTTSWREGAEALNQLAEKITVKSNLTAQDRHDLETVTYMGVQSFLERAPDDSERSQLSAEFLTRLMNNSSPVDWHMLSKMFLLSEDALPADLANETRTYILEGASTTLKNARHPDTPVSRYELSRYQASVALSKLQSR